MSVAMSSADVAGFSAAFARAEKTLKSFPFALILAICPFLLAQKFII